MLKEFKAFVSRGNVIDLAVAVILGAAFGAIIKSLVDDIIMPLVGIVLGGVDFTTLTLQVGNATLTYGNFIQAIVNFLVVAFALFLIIRSINKTQKQEAPAPAAPPEPSAEEKLLAEIRDLLKAKK
ncbi:MAG: large-conductance mechanosensitive channel protein MscL [Chloroflexi bacterium]|nr:large-conductance mechanosensitive channel protein MscL [Chloroflexota bacterium]MBK7176535.1 large-conductance mechanosensitive channel protein MscL [Chloroflexota bacterium]MBK7915514.1 large-conductance mechanosensitive channel protein MscL [Chloroflexota bacterium]MBK8933980.1 large-conductance mechanosensitive channel protein MscL [Chloroflexota bacterium]MBP7592963.1 large-conductance mechanosensitive channel protein MscL [Chloroflexota bacterium]